MALNTKKNPVIERDCPICETKIPFRDFLLVQMRLNINMLRNAERQMEIENIWNNKLLVIPCCLCFRIMNTVPKWKFRYNYEGSSFPTERDYIIGNIKFELKHVDIASLTPIVVKNLIKFGVI